MMKLRYKKRCFLDGHFDYVIQHQFLGLWFSYKVWSMYGGEYLLTTETEAQAQNEMKTLMDSWRRKKRVRCKALTGGKNDG
jgi:hypothetical protein